jgi:hypothetical protein
MRNRKSATIGITGLALGALLVGLAIVMDSDLGRAVNGIGGVLWFASTGLLTLAAARTRPPARLWVLLALVVITVAFIAKPSAIVPAVIGFVPAGLLLGAAAPRSRLLWAALVPAWYLPAHIGTAVLKSAVNSVLGNEAALRTDPPPTAAIVPLVMVACALLGGAIASRIRRAGHLGSPVSRERRLPDGTAN